MSSPFRNILKELYRLQQGGDIIISMVWPSCPQHAICYQNGGCEICWRCISSLFNCYCISINELYQHIGTLILFYLASFIIRLYLPKVFWSQTTISFLISCVHVCARVYLFCILTEDLNKGKTKSSDVIQENHYILRRMLLSRDMVKVLNNGTSNEVLRLRVNVITP